MNGMSGVIVAGVIAGLIATLISVLFREVWLKIVQAWYQNILYEDAKIEGQWYGKCDYFDTETEVGLLDIKHKEKPNYYNIQLKRIGHNIKGTMICERGWEEGRIYLINGTFKNLMLTATYEPNDKSSMERSSMTLMLKNNGRSLKGYVSMYMDEFDSVSPGKMIWTKEHAEGHLLAEEEPIKKEKDMNIQLLGTTKEPS